MVIFFMALYTEEIVPYKNWRKLSAVVLVGKGLVIGKLFYSGLFTLEAFFLLC